MLIEVEESMGGRLNLLPQSYFAIIVFLFRQCFNLFILIKICEKISCVRIALCLDNFIYHVEEYGNVRK